VWSRRAEGGNGGVSHLRRKRDIHVSKMSFGAISQDEEQRKRGDIEHGGRGAGAADDDATPAGIIYARTAKEAKEMYLYRASNQIASLGFFLARRLAT
jgi:hypothetical protein